MLRTSSVSIPGELRMRLLLELRLLLLLLIACAFAGRPMTECPGEVLDRPCPAEGGRPRKVVVKLDELGQFIPREPLLGHRLIDSGGHGGSPGKDGGGRSVSTVLLQPPAGFSRETGSQVVRLIVRALIRGSSLSLRSFNCQRNFHRPLMA